MEKADRCRSCDSVLLPEETHADHNACLKALSKRIDQFYRVPEVKRDNTTDLDPERGD